MILIMSCNAYVHIVCVYVHTASFSSPSISLYIVFVLSTCHSFSSYRICFAMLVESLSPILSGWRTWIMLATVVSLGNMRKRATDTCWVCWYYNTSNVMHCVVQWLVIHVLGLSTIFRFCSEEFRGKIWSKNTYKAYSWLSRSYSSE